MANTTAKLPTTTATRQDFSPGNDWTSPGNVTADDTNYASITAATYDTNDYSFNLDAQGFDFSEIPDGSTIDGIIVGIHAWYSAGTANYYEIKLLNGSGAKAGFNYAGGLSIGSSVSDPADERGSSNDTWGASLTASDVKSSSFGVTVCIQATADNTDINIDYITVQIYYTAPTVTVKKLAALGVG